MIEMLVVAVIFVYFTMAGFMWVLLIHHDAFDEIGATFGAAFWPAILPVAVGAWWAKMFREWRTRPKRVADALKPH